MLRLFHPFPALLVSAVTVGVVFVADHRPPAWTAFQLGAGMLLFQASIGAANDYVDYAEDRVARPWKPLARGLLSPLAARNLAVGLAAAGLILTVNLPVGAWLVGAAGLGCGLVYDAGLKRTRLSWLPMAIAFPLIPAWVYLALDRWEPLLWWAFPLGVMLGAGVHLANQLPDIEADRQAGSRGAAATAGARRTLALSLATWTAGIAVATAVLLTRDAGLATLVAVTGAIGGVTGVRATRLFGRDGLFGVLAVCSGGAALLFLSAV